MGPLKFILRNAAPKVILSYQLSKKHEASNPTGPSPQGNKRNRFSSTRFDCTSEVTHGHQGPRCGQGGWQDQLLLSRISVSAAACLIYLFTFLWYLAASNIGDSTDISPFCLMTHPCQDSLLFTINHVSSRRCRQRCSSLCWLASRYASQSWQYWRMWQDWWEFGKRHHVFKFLNLFPCNMTLPK